MAARAAAAGGRLHDARGASTLTITATLTAAVLATAAGDSKQTSVDLDGKRAYAAAQAGLQAYLYALNNNPSTWWQSCSNDIAGSPTQPIPVPGSTTGGTYYYTPVWANSSGGCNASNPVSSPIDNTTGIFRMMVTGYAGTPRVSRTTHPGSVPDSVGRLADVRSRRPQRCDRQRGSDDRQQ